MKKLIPLLAISSSVFAATNGAHVIYGEDGRKDVYEASAIYQQLARSTPVMIPSSELQMNLLTGLSSTNQTSFDLWLRKQFETKSLDEQDEVDELDDLSGGSLGFCPTERFISQPNPGMCSGFLIAPDLIVTAGHCTDVPDMCENYKWVFDFKVDPSTQKAGVEIPAENIYSCKKILRSSLNMMFMTDFGVIQLDRKVTGRRPLELRLNGKINEGQEIVVIGNPSGLPLKVTEGGKVRVNSHPMFFDANLDTYQGNSGSAVFNTSTKLVEGILVRGEEDFVLDQVNGCVTSNKCTDDGCRGESVSRITSIPEVALYDLVLKAVKESNIDKLNQILELGYIVDFNLASGETMLMKAAGLKNEEVVTRLLEKNASVHATDAKGNTALHHLASNMNSSDIALMMKLVEAGGDLNQKNDAGQTPAMLAKMNRNYVASMMLSILEAK